MTYLLVVSSVLLIILIVKDLLLKHPAMPICINFIQLRPSEFAEAIPEDAIIEAYEELSQFKSTDEFNVNAESLDVMLEILKSAVMNIELNKKN